MVIVITPWYRGGTQQHRHDKGHLTCARRMYAKSSGKQNHAPPPEVPADYFRFHLPHLHLSNVFGNDWFALKAEGFARFFGTPIFLVAQTVIVAIWIGVNVLGYTKFDVYPFILLNLAFSLQAAYAAPLILLAQTLQADRDKVHADADAQHREALALASEQRQALAAEQADQLLVLVQQNTDLTELIKELSQRIETLTIEMHRKVIQDATKA
jgi:uncharacterized membrane protein